MDSFHYVVVGAGFAGCTIAERIANILGKEVLIIEKRPHIGGNCYDYRNEKNILVHKYGPIFSIQTIKMSLNISVILRNGIPTSIGSLQ